MFCSGSAARRILARENRRQTLYAYWRGRCYKLYILYSDLGLPSLLYQPTGHCRSNVDAAGAHMLHCGPRRSVIARVLGLAHNAHAFVSLILGSAVLRDIVLWVVLADCNGAMPTNQKNKSLGAQ